jgi:hypothetical protein
MGEMVETEAALSKAEFAAIHRLAHAFADYTKTFGFEPALMHLPADYDAAEKMVRAAIEHNDPNFWYGAPGACGFLKG